MSHDTVIHRIVRPGVRLIARTEVTPNQVTTLRLVTGLATGAMFATGGGLLFDLAGAVFIISMLLDRADGELARQTGQMSLAGYRYDLWSDCLANVAVFIGIGIGLAPADWLGLSTIWLGAIAGLGIALLFWELNVVKLAPVQGYSFFGGRVVVDPDDAMILVPILVWCGFAYVMLIAAAIVTPLAALWLALAYWKTRGAAAKDQ